ncbi:TPA: hypothetical protein ACJGQM_004178, partial [Salmonella enterica subsp. enterica]
KLIIFILEIQLQTLLHKKIHYKTYSIALCSCLFPSATVITLCRYNKIAPKETLSVTDRATIDIQPVISLWEIKT